MVNVSLSRKAEFTTEEKYFDSDEQSKMNVTLSTFNDSMVFAFGFASYEPDFDPLNNNYFDIVSYRMTTGEVLEIDDQNELHKCVK